MRNGHTWDGLLKFKIYIHDYSGFRDREDP